jgi:uncharacterized protein (TIGR03032 family)
MSGATSQPFQVSLSGQMAQLLSGLGVALAIASYQSGSVLLVSASGVELSVLPRAFNKPMSIASHGNRLAIACRDELVVLANSNSLAPGFPRTPGRYKHLWLPRRVAFTGEIDLHDIAFGPQGVVGVATRFSCLAGIDDSASFTPFWQPPFITDIVPEDRCHLNGMALDATGQPRFVTALGKADTAEGWRAERATGGVLLSVPEGRVVLGGLSMPHSPRLIDGGLYVLNSGAGEVLRVDAQAGPAQVLARLPGYTRGMEVVGDILFIGTSRLRDRKGAGSAPLPVEADGQALQCGVFAVERASGRVLGGLHIASGAEEISDLAVLQGAGWHGILNHTDNTHRAALALPQQGFWAEAGPKA